MSALRRILLLATVAVVLAPGAAYADAPSIGTLAANHITSSTATVTAIINPNGQATRYRVAYGGVGDAGFRYTPYVDIGAGTAPVAVSVQLTGLAFDWLHAYQFEASNDDGNTTLLDFFQTGKLEPTVTTSAATAVAETGATLSGTVHPHGLPTTYEFQVSPDPAFSSLIKISGSAGSGSTALPVSATFTALTSGTLYYYRLSATNNEGGTSFSPTRSFQTTSPMVSAAPNPAPPATPTPVPTAPTVSGNTVTCAASSAPCTAQLVVTVPTPKVGERKPKTKTTVIAKATVTIPAGVKRTLTYKLNATGTKLLRTKRKLTATVKTTIAYGAAQPLTTTHRVVLHAPAGRSNRGDRI